MPTLSRFLGIVIVMYWSDHLPPHFHAKYGDYEITVELETGIVDGKFPRRALRHVLEWHELHQDELWQAWDACSQQKTPRPSAPLE